jgi:hypothetical protein
MRDIDGRPVDTSEREDLGDYDYLVERARESPTLWCCGTVQRSLFYLCVVFTGPYEPTSSSALIKMMTD